jgi:hypothetical protein
MLRVTNLSGFAETGLQTIEFTIAANTTQINLLTLAGSPVTPANYVFKVEAGVYVYSTTTTVPAISVSAFPVGSTITLVNNGQIIGKGGGGGSGASATDFTGNAGGIGGNAIGLFTDVFIDNTNGYIFGGGGGGGGGGLEQTSLFSSNIYACGGGGGGGRSGLSNSAGGAGGQLGGAQGAAAQNGTAGTRTGRGTGGEGGHYGNNLDGANGGHGGEYGAAGSAPAQPTGTSQGGTGGAAGKAVLLNGNAITWLGGNNTNQVKGAVS